jgi:hypothetical protein
MESGSFFPLIVVLVGLLWIYVSFRYLLYYHGLISNGNGTGDPDKNWRIFRWAQVSLLVACLFFTGALVNLFNLPKVDKAPVATATIALDEGVGQPLPTSSPFTPLPPAASPLSSPTPGVVPGSGTARIGNTNGFGVFVRAEPGLKYEMLTELSDGSRVELTGEAQSADGFTWQRVHLEDGRVGWIAENFLIPEP